MAQVVRNPDRQWGPVGEFGAWDWLDAKTWSAHAFITPDGQVIQAVSPLRVAFHAGQSEWEGRAWLNDTFLGAEWLVAGTHDYSSWLTATTATDCYSEAQYHAGAWLYASWLRDFPHLSLERILPHSTVAGDHVRGEGKGKQDPGPGFSWHEFTARMGVWLEEFDR
jgi:N-acetyl-anhydromuramyl-L-alanine amidase AmpD